MKRFIRFLTWLLVIVICIAILTCLDLALMALVDILPVPWDGVLTIGILAVAILGGAWAISK